MLGGRAGEVVSRRETPSQCGRVGSPGIHTVIQSAQIIFVSYKRACPKLQKQLNHLCLRLTCFFFFGGGGECFGL